LSDVSSYPHDYDRIHADSVHATGGALNP